jgi:chemotaxis protein MotA|tara:strand:+ start:82 stop:927 length:846 start_codon:yes stop_codon:yes gene_type:complete
MNIGTIIGFGVGLLVLIVSILLAVKFQFAQFLLFADLASLVIVLGMTVAATFIAYPLEDVKNVIDAFKRAFSEDESAVEQYITEMATISMAYARGGTSRLSAMAEEYTENQFIKDGLKMVEDRYTETDIRSIMTAQIRNEQQRLSGQVKIIQNMSSNAPAFGVLGTLIGLVVMMSGLDPSDTEKLMQGLGGGMATALLTTFYGVLFSNFFFSPIATKVEKRIEDQVIMMNVIMQGALLIMKKTPENMVRDKLKVYLPVQWASISASDNDQTAPPPEAAQEA